MAGGSTKAVYAALFGNLGIAITKFVAAFMTGSTSMYAEAYHSSSDTFNQVLLLFGIKISTKGATQRFQFGRGKEQFFWSFIVAAMLFGISGVLSMEHGFSSLLGESHVIENVTISYVVLAIAFAFEVNALRIAYSLFKETIEIRGEKVNLNALITEFKETKDPTIITVIVEDLAALLGIMIAAAGIFLSDITGNSIFDAIASITIGVVLMAFAFFLAKENKGLLIGEALSTANYMKISERIVQVPEVKHLISMKTMHLGSTDVVIGIEIELRDELVAGKVEYIIDKIEREIKQVVPFVKREHIFIEVEKPPGDTPAETGRK